MTAGPAETARDGVVAERPAEPGSRDAAPTVIVVGPLTTAAAARLLEQQLAVVWTALLEQAGGSVGEGWALRLDGLRLVKVGRREGDVGGPGR